MPTRRAESEDSDREYASKEYWESRYKRKLDPSDGEQADRKRPAGEPSSEETDEWFFNYANVEFLLHAYCLNRRSKEEVSLLDVGCGNSPFLIDMRKDGWSGRAAACDFSLMALKAFEQKCQDAKVPTAWKDSTRPAKQLIKLVECDCRRLLDYFPRPVDIIIDKGTMDAMYVCAHAHTDNQCPNVVFDKSCTGFFIGCRKRTRTDDSKVCANISLRYA